MASTAMNRFDDAEKQLAMAKQAKDDPSLKSLYISTVNTGSAVAAIAYEVAAGEIRARQKRAA